jgi:hypothetical protein
MAGHVYVRVSGYGWTLLPFAPFRMEQLRSDPPTVRVEYFHPDGPRAATLRIDGPDVRFTAEPGSLAIDDIVEMSHGPRHDCWRLETDPFSCDWPEGFALWDQSRPFSLHGRESSLIWIQGPVPAKNVPPPERLAASGQSIISIADLESWTRIELAYEHNGQPWRQVHRVRDAGPTHKIGVTSQAPLPVAAETHAAGDLVATSMRPNQPA